METFWSLKTYPSCYSALKFVFSGNPSLSSPSCPYRPWSPCPGLPGDRCRTWGLPRGLLLDLPFVFPIGWLPVRCASASASIGSIFDGSRLVEVSKLAWLVMPWQQGMGSDGRERGNRGGGEGGQRNAYYCSAVVICQTFCRIWCMEFPVWSYLFRFLSFRFLVLILQV